MRTKEEVLKCWADQESTPDFKPILDELLIQLEEQEKLIADLSKRDEWLSYLEAAGIDNTSAYEYAIKLRNDDNNDLLDE